MTTTRKGISVTGRLRNIFKRGSVHVTREREGEFSIGYVSQDNDNEHSATLEPEPKRLTSTSQVPVEVLDEVEKVKVSR